MKLNFTLFSQPFLIRNHEQNFTFIRFTVTIKKISVQLLNSLNFIDQNEFLNIRRATMFLTVPKSRVVWNVFFFFCILNVFSYIVEMSSCFYSFFSTILSCVSYWTLMCALRMSTDEVFQFIFFYLAFQFCFTYTHSIKGLVTSKPITFALTWVKKISVLFARSKPCHTYISHSLNVCVQIMAVEMSNRERFPSDINADC